MFEKKKDTEKLLGKLIAILVTNKPGDIVPHADLASAIGYSPPDAKYYALARRARERYRESSGVWTREVPGVGYRFLTAEESLTEEQSYRRKRSRRQLNIGIGVADVIPDENLTEHQRRIKHHVLESHNKMRRELLAEERHEKWLLRPTSDKSVAIRPPRLASI